MYRITQESVEELREGMRKEKNKNAYRRMQAVALRGEGKNNEEISLIVGIHPNTVGQLCKAYCVGGMGSLREDGRKGGNHRNLSEEKTAEYLHQFEEKAAQGHVVGIKEMAAAYDKIVGKEHKSPSTVYYLLHTNAWRSVMPRRQHPNKASGEEIESSKKLTPNTRK